MRTLGLTVLLLFGAGCLDQLPPEDPHTPVEKRGACTALEGLTFRSVDQGECGLTPDGVSLCTWSIAFETVDGTKSRFTWRHSDVGETGHVTCENGVIQTEPGSFAYQGMFDDANLDLVWDTRAYVAAP